MHFDGVNYLLDYRAARRGADEQLRITAPESVSSADSAVTEFRANVFNAIPGALVEWRIGDRAWQPMTKTENETDPLFQTLFDEEQRLLPDKLQWRKLAKPIVCPHLWKASFAETVKAGTYAIEVRATNPNGQVLKGERIIRIE
jgi:hypothetical protein